METSNNITGERLRRMRVAKKMSQEDVAKVLGISRTGYNKYESGDIKPVRKLKELSVLFGVSTDYILGRDDPVSKAAPRDIECLKKYMSLSDMGKEVVDITLNAVYERERSGLYVKMSCGDNVSDNA